MRGWVKGLVVVVCAGVVACTGDAPPELGPPAASPRAHLRELKGSVKVKRADGDEWKDAENGMALFENDKVKTAPGGSALVALANGSQLVVDQEALIGIAETRPRPGQDRTDVTVLQGRVDAELPDPNQSLSVTTPSATVRAGREIVFQ